MRKVELVPTRDCEAGYGPGYVSLYVYVYRFFFLFVCFPSLPAMSGKDGKQCSEVILG